MEWTELGCGRGIAGQLTDAGTDIGGVEVNCGLCANASFRNQAR